MRLFSYVSQNKNFPEIFVVAAESMQEANQLLADDSMWDADEMDEMLACYTCQEVDITQKGVVIDENFHG